MGLLVRGIWPLAALIALVLAAPAAAAPSWSEPVDLAPPGATFPMAAMDARGNTLVTWAQYENGAYSSAYRWWQPASGWGEVRQLHVDRGGVVDVEITPHGAATVLLARGESGAPNKLTVATAEPGGPIGDFETVTTEASSPSNPGFGLGLDDVGNAILAWTRWSDPYGPDEPRPGYVASRRAGGEFGPPQLVGHFRGSPIGITINAAGAAAVAWQDAAVKNADSPGWTIPKSGPSITYRPPGGSFGPPEWYGHYASSVKMGIDVLGRLAVATDTAYLSPGPDSRARYAVRSPLGEWSDSQVLDAEASIADLFVEPRGAITFLLNRRPESGDDNEVHFRTVEPDGRVDGGQLSSGITRGWPIGAMNLRGGILAAWLRPSGDASEVVVRERGTVGAFAPEVVVARGGRHGVFEATLNDAGQALVVLPAEDPQMRPFGQGLRAVVRDDPALRELPPPPDADIYSDPLATLDGDGDLLAPVSCDVGCKVSANGIVFPGGEAKALAGDGATQRLKAGRRTKVKLDFGRAGRRAVKAALARGRKPWVSVQVSARGKSPRPFVVSKRFKIRR